MSKYNVAENEMHIKGTHIINVIEFVRRKKGAIGLKMLFDRINQNKVKPRHFSEKSFQEKDWYPYDLYLEFLATADDVTGVGDLSRCYEIGFQTIQHLGHLSYLARAPNIHDFIKNATENWFKVYDFGRIEIVQETARSIILRYHGFPKSKAKCEYYKGSLSGMMDLCRLKGDVKKTACNTEGASYCEYVLTWK